MKYIRKIAAAILAVALIAGVYACTPSKKYRMKYTTI